jgi:hypothetical protein
MSIRARLAAKSGLLAVLGASLIGLSTTAGCANVGDGMQEKLYETTRAYNRALRWADYDRAAEYVPAEAENEFLDDHGQYDEELVMIDYNLTRLKMEQQQGIATCRVKLSWHTDRDVVVRDTEVEQVWQFFQGQWFLVDERRVDGEPLALFAERGENDELRHPYLPGLLEFRDERDIGISDKEQKKRDRERRKAKKAAGDPQGADLPLGGEKHQLPTDQHQSEL